MAEPARPLAPPPGLPMAAPFRDGAAATTIAVPVPVWPAIPAPGWCPAAAGQVLCPRWYTAAAARAVISALSRPGDVVAAPRPGDEVFLAAAASTGRRAAWRGGTGTAALARGLRVPGTRLHAARPCSP